MDLPSFQALLTPAGQTALAAAAALQPREPDFLTHYQHLAKTHPPELVRAALETAILRTEAHAKFPPEIAGQLYLTREALEQASPWAVSAHRAARFMGFDLTLDLACSIGADTIHLAPAFGIDRDPLRLHIARANLAALGLPAHFLLADLNHPLPVSPSPLPRVSLFFDPARRTDHRRAYSVRDYSPPLDVIKTWLPHIPALGVKISPGVNLDELTDYDCEIEFISLNGELKEACLWFGPLKTAGRRATLLPENATLTADDQPPSTVSAPRSFLYEPDPAILRAGLVGTLAAQISAAQLDPTIAYLTSGTRVATPFARSWEVVDWMPFSLKRLRAYCRERNIGRVTVKKRGSAITPEALIAGLKLKGDNERVLVLTRWNGNPVVLVCMPYA